MHAMMDDWPSRRITAKLKQITELKGHSKVIFGAFSGKQSGNDWI